LPLVKIRRNLVKNTVGKNSFGGEDSLSETGMAWAGTSPWVMMMGDVHTPRQHV
jgi:hypothetical protein